MRVQFTVDIGAPDEKMREAGESYVTLYRSLEMPTPPTVGLKVNFPVVEEFDQEEFDRLFSDADNPSGILRVDSVLFNAADMSYTAHCTREVETVDAFKASIRFFKKFYGFASGTV
jgi:hypothetical protein